MTENVEKYAATHKKISLHTIFIRDIPTLKKIKLETGAAYGSPARCKKLLTPIYHRALDGNQGLRNGTAHLLQQNLSGVPYPGSACSVCIWGPE